MPDTPAIETAGEHDQTLSRPLWTSAEIVAATHGRLEGETFAASGVNFNSQEIEAGDLFVALKGARDGHEFAPGAFGRGAGGALVEHPVEGGACVVVPDTLKGLEALGVAARQRARLRAAVTGSVGKTSVTQAIKAGLDLAGTSHASIKSFNNHIGVPLTLARTPHGTERAVFEIGMNAPGEIAPLSHLVRPHAACVTTIGPVHIEAFEDAERGVAREKASIFDGLIEGGTAVIPADTLHDAVLRAAAQRAGARIRTFGSRPGADARLIGFNPTPQGGRGRFELDGRTHDFTLSQSGVHWGLNTLCVVLMLEAMDVPVETALAALAGFQPLAGRGQSRTVHVDGGAFTLIDESYNANPLSMAAGFKSLAARSVTGAGRRVVVLSDMLELGVQSRSLHEGLAGAIEAAGLDLVHTAGPEMRALHAALPEHRRGLWRETAQELAEAASALAGPNDLVMVKGSNGSKASLVAAALAALDAGADTAKLDKAPVSRKRAAPSKAASRAPSKPSAPRGQKAD